MSIKNLGMVFSSFDIEDKKVRKLFLNSIREAGQVMAPQMAAASPAVRPATGASYERAHRLADSFGVWYSRAKSARARAAIFRVGLTTNYFYVTLAKGRKASGYRARIKPSHPDWKLPGESARMVSATAQLAKRLFEAKMNKR